MLSNEDSPISSSTKRCACGSPYLVKLSSQDLKICNDCHSEIEWPLDQGQTSLNGSHRAGRLNGATEQ